MVMATCSAATVVTAPEVAEGAAAVEDASPEAGAAAALTLVGAAGGKGARCGVLAFARSAGPATSEAKAPAPSMARVSRDSGIASSFVDCEGAGPADSGFTTAVGLTATTCGRRVLRFTRGSPPRPEPGAGAGLFFTTYGTTALSAASLAAGIPSNLLSGGSVEENLCRACRRRLLR